MPKTDKAKYATYANTVFKKFCILPKSTPQEIIDLLIEPADYRLQHRLESIWFADKRRQSFFQQTFGDPNWKLFSPIRNRIGM
jgi:hypothetical protein